MKIKIISKEHNPLLKRKDVIFTLDHSQEGKTCSRLELRRHLANMLKVKPELVYIKKVETKTGTMTAIGESRVYETLELAEKIEPKHIVARNRLPVKEVEAEKPVESAVEDTAKPVKEVEAEKPVESAVEDTTEPPEQGEEKESTSKGE